MLAAAIGDNALQIEDDSWVVVNWDQYQETDHTAAERQRRSRMSRRDTREIRRDPSMSMSSSVTSVAVKEKKTDSSVDEVYLHWVEKTGRDRSRTKLTRERETKIVARMARFTVIDLKTAVDGLMKSDFHRSKPEYTDLVSCFANDSKVEQHIARASNGNGNHSPFNTTQFLPGEP